MNSKENDVMEIDLLQLLRAIIHRLWAVVLVTVVAAIVAFSYATFMITPLYKASALMYVNNSDISLAGSSFSISSGSLTAAKSLVDTYTVILKTRMTLNTVIERAGLSYSYETLYSMIETSSVNETEIFEIVVTSHDPQEAERIANTIAEVLPEKISSIVDGSSVKLVDYAVVPSQKASPSVTKITIMGGVVGFVAICGVIVVMELLDNLVKDEDYLLHTYKLPVLAAIPELDSSGSGGYRSYGNGGGR